MVVYGGIHLLAEDDDDDLFGQRKSTDRVTAPTSVYLPPSRAWFSLYNQRDRAGVPGGGCAPSQARADQRALSDDVMLEMFKRMSPVAVAGAACSCGRGACSPRTRTYGSERRSTRGPGASPGGHRACAGTGTTTAGVACS